MEKPPLAATLFAWAWELDERLPETTADRDYLDGLLESLRSGGVASDLVFLDCETRARLLRERMVTTGELLRARAEKAIFYSPRYKRFFQAPSGDQPTERQPP